MTYCLVLVFTKEHERRLESFRRSWRTLVLGLADLLYHGQARRGRSRGRSLADNDGFGFMTIGRDESVGLGGTRIEASTSL